MRACRTLVLVSVASNRNTFVSSPAAAAAAAAVGQVFDLISAMRVALFGEKIDDRDTTRTRVCVVNVRFPCIASTRLNRRMLQYRALLGTSSLIDADIMRMCRAVVKTIIIIGRVRTPAHHTHTRRAFAIQL